MKFPGCVWLYHNYSDEVLILCVTGCVLMMLLYFLSRGK